MNLHPLPIRGPWDRGVTLDLHTVSAEFLGYDLNERPLFDTVRSEVGELLFRCKYRSDRNACAVLAEIAADFLWANRVAVDVVVPVPPSKIRPFQPLQNVASQVASRLGVRYDQNSLVKVKETLEIKSVEDLDARRDALADAFVVEGDSLAGRAVLLFDDLYRSGASMSAAARVLRAQGRASYIVAMALTRTRNRT